MASSAQPSFPPRTYPSALSKLPERSAFAPPSTAQQRDAARREQAEKERLEREGHDPMNQLSEEQREEINEAVRSPPLPSSPLIPPHCTQQDTTSHPTADAPAPPQFGLFDLDKDKRIDYHELKVAMKALGFDPPKADLVAVLQAHGVPAQPHPGANPAHPSRLLLPLAAFQQLMAQRILARDPREEILRAFDLFDEGGKGKIDLADLRRVARELGEGLGEEELAAMIDEFDLDGDGAIDREEFVGICLQ
ncbi:Calcium-binding component of the spindle pole body (SPB) half-bridge [Lambiella insularis]|nr:Calcium-binding component of the spindle pole body (SPB) half-bridge [Lambiella insularis]